MAAIILKCSQLTLWCILPCSFLSQSFSFSNLLSQKAKTEIEAPSRKNIIRKDRLIQGSKEMVVQKLALFLANLSSRKQGLHLLNHARLDWFSLLNATNLQPLDEILMKTRVAQQRPQLLLGRRNPQLFMMVCQLKASDAEIVGN